MFALSNGQLLDSLVGAVYVFEGLHWARDTTELSVQVVTEEMLSRELAVAFPLEKLNKDAEIAANTFKLEDLVPNLRIGHRIIVAKVEDGVIKICYECCATWREFRDVALWMLPTHFVVLEFISTFFSPRLASKTLRIFICGLASVLLLGQSAGLFHAKVKMTARRYAQYILLHLCIYLVFVYFAGDLYAGWTF